MEMELGLGFEEAFKNSVSIADDLPPEKLTVESISLLEDGISLILSQWTQLQWSIARDKLLLGSTVPKEFINSTGARIKCNKSVHEIHSEIFNWFTQSKGPLRTGALKVLLFRAVLRAYKCHLGDGSPRKVAGKLMDLYKECLQKSASRRGGEAASLKGRCVRQGRRASGAREKPY